MIQEAKIHLLLLESLLGFGWQDIQIAGLEQKTKTVTFKTGCTGDAGSTP